MVELFAVTAGLLFGLALYALLTRRGVIQRLLAANVMATAVFLFLIVRAAAGETMDPVPQAMVLTGIVIAVSITAFALALVRWFQSATGRSSLEAVPEVQGSRGVVQAEGDD